jgi:hypothetical protein
MNYIIFGNIKQVFMSISPRLKKIIIAIIFLGLIVFFGYLLWKLFFQAETITPGQQINSSSTVSGLPSAGTGGNTVGNITGSGNLPGGDNPIASGTPIGTPSSEASAPSPTASGGLTAVSALISSQVLDPTVSSDGGIRYYNKDDGHFYKLDDNGKAVKMSDKVFHEADSVTWSPSGDKAIISYPDKSKIMYNFSTDKQVTLPSYWQDFSFSGDSEQIVAKSIGLDVENNWLIVSGSDGSKATALEDIGANADTVYPSWSPNNQIVAMYTKGVDFNRQEIYFVGLNGENFKSTLVEGRGLQTQWSTAGDTLLYSVYNTADEMKPRLWIVDATADSIGENRRSFNLQTWASKCTYATDTEIYCAVPEELQAGAGMFPELADQTKDNLYKIDLATGTQKLIAIPNGAYNISQILVPEDQKTLYFTDKSTQLIYKVEL